MVRCEWVGGFDSCEICAIARCQWSCPGGKCDGVSWRLFDDKLGKLWQYQNAGAAKSQSRYRGGRWVEPL